MPPEKRKNEDLSASIPPRKRKPAPKSQSNIILIAVGGIIFVVGAVLFIFSFVKPGSVQTQNSDNLPTLAVLAVTQLVSPTADRATLPPTWTAVPTTVPNTTTEIPLEGTATTITTSFAI